MSDVTARVADATGNWVDTHAPSWSRPYLRLCPFRPPDRLLAAADAVLVVGGAGRRHRARRQSIVARHRAVLHRRLRDARRGLHLERHHRSRSRRQGRAHAVAADPGRAGQRAAGVGVPGAAGAGRACGAAAVQPLRDHDRHRLADHRRGLSLHEAHHLVAAGRARPRLLLGRADGICGHARAGSISPRSCSMPARSPG